MDYVEVTTLRNNNKIQESKERKRQKIKHFPSRGRVTSGANHEAELSLNEVTFKSNWLFSLLRYEKVKFPYWRCYIQLLNVRTTLLRWDFLSTKFLCSWDTYNVLKVFVPRSEEGMCILASCLFLVNSWGNMCWRHIKLWNEMQFGISRFRI